jgi:entericidin B
MKTFGLVVALTTMAALTACNTVNGAGKDMKSAGTAMRKVSSWNGVK